MKRSKLRDFTAVLAKIMEIIAFVGCAISIIGALAIALFREPIVNFYASSGALGSELSVSGVNIQTVTEKNFIPTIIIALITATIILALAAIMFRNINLIFRKTNTDSPFAQANVKLIKQIGIAALSIPAVKIIANIIFGLFIHNMMIEAELSELLFGLVILCLAQYFAYGASLEKDVDGLL